MRAATIRDAQDALLDFGSTAWTKSVARAMDADIAGAYRIDFAEASTDVSLNEWEGIDRDQFRARFVAACRTSPEIVAMPAFDPHNPSRRQSNRIIRPMSMCSYHPSTSKVRRFNDAIAAPLGIELPKYDQVRSLVFHGDRFLGWFGAIRPKRFTTREARTLASLLPFARARLLYQTSALTTQASAFETLLARTHEVVFCIDASGWVVATSSAAKGLYDLDSHGTLERIRHATEVVPISSNRRLVFLHDEVGVIDQRIRTRWKEWQLTKREHEVATALALGFSTKEIAASLTCAPGTVEIHVGRILAKARVETRARFVARVWSRR